MLKKRGFTLIEVLTVILVSTLVMAMIGATMLFTINTTGDLIQQAEEIEMAKNIESYYRNLYNDGIYDLDFNLSLENGNIKHGNKIIFSDTGLEKFDITPGFDDGFIRCEMIFESGRKFDFIIGLQPQKLTAFSED